MGWIASLSNIFFIGIILAILLYGVYQKINVFDAFTTGAKQGFETAVHIIPYLIAMMTATGMLRASGFFDVLSHIMAPVLAVLGMPPELLPLALLRPFSGSAATGMMADVMHTHGGDSIISNMAATMMGSTETTFYVVAVYFGAVGVRHVRHAIWAGLLADLAGIMASIIACRMFL